MTAANEFRLPTLGHGRTGYECAALAECAWRCVHCCSFHLPPQECVKRWGRLC